jgi:naphthalene 1,2-dioxygenase system ferredoxin subunit
MTRSTLTASPEFYTQELHVTTETNKVWITVASRSSLGRGEMRGVTVDGHEVAIFNIEGEIYATDNICTHAYALLTDGCLEDNVVECPLHGGCFEVKTGKGMCAPILHDLTVYAVQIVGDEVQVKLGV